MCALTNVHPVPKTGRHTLGPWTRVVPCGLLGAARAALLLVLQSLPAMPHALASQQRASAAPQLDRRRSKRMRRSARRCARRMSRWRAPRAHPRALRPCFSAAAAALPTYSCLYSIAAAYAAPGACAHIRIRPLLTVPRGCRGTLPQHVGRAGAAYWLSRTGSAPIASSMGEHSAASCNWVRAVRSQAAAAYSGLILPLRARAMRAAAQA